VALGRAEVAARLARVDVQWVHAGLLDAPLARESFDLVSAQYPALLRTPARDAERSLLAAVAPAGHLLVVHHLLTEAAIKSAKAHGFDPGDYVSPRDVAALLDEAWQVAFDEQRPRDLSTGAGAHHTHDVILHAGRAG
jgi:hypothetical protein